MMVESRDRQRESKYGWALGVVARYSISTSTYSTLHHIEAPGYIQYIVAPLALI